MQKGSGNGGNFDVYVRRGLGYTGEEIWDPVTIPQRLDKGDAEDLVATLEKAGKATKIVQNDGSTAPPHSLLFPPAL